MMTISQILRRSLAGAVMLCMLAPAAQAQTKIAVGDSSPLPPTWPLMIADKKGYFAKEGLEIATDYTGSNPLIAQRVVAGSLDIGVVTYETGVRAIAAGAPLKFVGAMMRAFPYLVMADQTITKPEDLKGTRVMLTLPKSILSVFWDRWVEEQGMSAADMEQVFDPSTPNRFAALESGTVKAAVLTQPFTFRAEDRGYHAILDLGKRAKDFGFLALVVRQDWAEENPEAVKAYLRAVSSAVQFFYDPTNKEEAIAILVEKTKMDRELSAKAYDYYTKELRPFDAGLDLPDVQLTTLFNMLEEIGDIKNLNKTPSRYIDRSYLPTQQ